MNQSESKINNDFNQYLVKAAEDYFKVSSSKIWIALKTDKSAKLTKRAKRKNQQQKYLYQIIF